MRNSQVWITVLALCALTSAAHARTWTVELDGSGDFTVIQDALDAAAPGDSIQIGPGRFDTFRPGASVVDGYQFAAIAWVTTSDLTIIGAGPEATHLGPAVPTLEVDGRPAVSLYIDGGAVSHVEGIGLDNSQFIAAIREQSVVQDCRVDYVPLTNASAVTVLAAHDVVIREVDVFGPDAIIIAAGSQNVVVEDCWFEGTSSTGHGVDVVGGSQNCIVRRCTFVYGVTGVSFGGGTGEIEDCTFTSMSFSGVNVDTGTATIRRCLIGETQQPLRVNVAAVEVYDSVLEGGGVATIVTAGQLLVRNSHLLNSGALTVRGRTSAPGEIVDLRHNWWGTSDQEQIEAWIDDPYGTVLWQPIAGMPVPTDVKSMSELKGQFVR